MELLIIIDLIKQIFCQPYSKNYQEKHKTTEGVDLQRKFFLV